jgi:uncharacterized Zn finger protein
MNTVPGMLDAHVSPRCPECSFQVFNRRYPKCESCGTMLPETIVYTAVERHALHLVEEERSLAKERSDHSAVDRTPVSLDDALVSAMMGLTER